MRRISFFFVRLAPFRIAVVWMEAPHSCLVLVLKHPSHFGVHHNEGPLLYKPWRMYLLGLSIKKPANDGEPVKSYLLRSYSPDGSDPRFLGMCLQAFSYPL